METGSVMGGGREVERGRETETGGEADTAGEDTEDISEMDRVGGEGGTEQAGATGAD